MIARAALAAIILSLFYKPLPGVRSQDKFLGRQSDIGFANASKELPIFTFSTFVNRDNIRTRCGEVSLHAIAFIGYDNNQARKIGRDTFVLKDVDLLFFKFRSFANTTFEAREDDKISPVIICDASASFLQIYLRVANFFEGGGWPAKSFDMDATIVCGGFAKICNFDIEAKRNVAPYMLEQAEGRWLDFHSQPGTLFSNKKILCKLIAFDGSLNEPLGELKLSSIYLSLISGAPSRLLKKTNGDCRKPYGCDEQSHSEKGNRVSRESLKKSFLLFLLDFAVITVLIVYCGYTFGLNLIGGPYGKRKENKDDN